MELESNELLAGGEGIYLSLMNLPKPPVISTR